MGNALCNKRQLTEKFLSSENMLDKMHNDVTVATLSMGISGEEETADYHNMNDFEYLPHQIKLCKVWGTLRRILLITIIFSFLSIDQTLPKDAQNATYLE